MKTLQKFTFGCGDRFGHQGNAQLQAMIDAQAMGLDLYPVWNKSNREHTLIHSVPADLRAEADAAVAALGWTRDYYVDADHISLKTVDGFIEASDFFTLDVADFTGRKTSEQNIEAFVSKIGQYSHQLSIPGIETPLDLSESVVRATAEKFLRAIEEAGAIYRHVEARKASPFATEISVDETDTPQTPTELFLILAMIAGEKIPVQTIAPKFTGRFNKGVEYEGSLSQFEIEFDQDLSVIAYAISEFGLPATLKLSVHSGSDKFSLYPIINRLIKKHDAGLHVKTAGTTWLEEVIGLSESGPQGLALAQAIYAQAHARYDELTGPYATVLHIDQTCLPSPATVNTWGAEKFANTLRHDQDQPDYNPHFRQLMHVGFKVAAEFGPAYTDALKANASLIAKNVTNNLLARHIIPIFK